MSAQPTLDPQFVPFLQALASLPPLWSQSVQDVRKMWDLSVYGRPEEVGAVRELTIPVADGTIAARRCRAQFCACWMRATSVTVAVY